MRLRVPDPAPGPHLEGVQIVGLDADEELIAQARRELQREDLDDRVGVVCGDAYQLPFADESFDMVTSHTVLCIMSDPATGLREQIRVVRKGGVVSAVVCFCHTDGCPTTMVVTRCPVTTASTS